MKSLILILALVGASSSYAQCFSIQQILVDACTSLANEDGKGEFVILKNGATPKASNLINANWPANTWNNLCAPPNGLITQMNATITSCGHIVAAPAIIPANAKVILFTNTDFDPNLFSFAGLSDTLYALFQCSGNTAGHFANYGASASRTTTISWGNGCSQTVTYDRALLVQQDGTSGGENGAMVVFDANGDGTYINNGCSIPATTALNPAWTPTTICASENLNLTTRLTPTSTTGGTWSGSGVTGSTLNPSTLPAGTTSVSVTYTVGGGSCQKTETHTIMISPQASIDLTVNPATGNAPLTTTITTTGTFGQQLLKINGDTLPNSNSNYNWNGTNGLTFNTVGTYEVCVIGSFASNQCGKDTSCQIIIVTKKDTTLLPLSIFIPNIFTPNGDATNDRFEIKVSNFKSLKGSIYNRWGVEVANLNTSLLYWDGKGCSEGVYFYTLEVEDLFSKTTSYKGSVTLIQ